MVPLQLPGIATKKKPAPWLMGVAIAGIVTIAGGSYVISRGSTTQINLDLYTQTVESQSLTVRIEASGTLNPAQSVNVSPKVAGIVQQLLVEQGDRVTKGQVLALMDRRDLAGQQVQAQAAIGQAQARLNELLAGNRAEEIAQSEARAAIAKAELLRRQNNRQEEIAEAENQVFAAQARADLAQERVNRYAALQKAGAETRDRLDEVRADNEVAQANVREARKRLTRTKERISSEIQQANASWQEAQEALQLAKKGARPETIAQARAAVKEAQGRLKVIETQVQDTVVRAPFSGTVTQKYASAGAFVTPTTSASATSSATSASIVAIARDLEVLAKVPEVDIGKIRKGQQVEIKADSYPDQIFKGQVRLVAPEAVVEQNVTSFQVRVSLVTGENKLRSGMNADLTFLGDQIDNALVVPTVAIATQKGQTGVYLPNADNQPEFHEVTIGSTIGNKTQVLEGLESGQRVFTDFPEGIEPKDETET